MTDCAGTNLSERGLRSHTARDWERFNARLVPLLPLVQILHPYPEQDQRRLYPAWIVVPK
jgi:hypothetical protein